jgi:hypothetical protein
VFPGDEGDVDRFFGDGGRSRKGSWKALQLCKQVERVASLALEGEWVDGALLGAVVASVEPAPDESRLRVVIVLAPDGGKAGFEHARVALLGLSARLRSEVARWIHRKRVPEIVFDVRLGPEVNRG